MEERCRDKGMEVRVVNETRSRYRRDDNGGVKTKGMKKGMMCHLLPVSKKGSHACSCDSKKRLFNG